MTYTPDKAATYRDVLANSNVVLADIKGCSMNPLLRQGIGYVAVIPATTFNIGDILLFENPLGGMPVLHRLVAKEGDVLVTRGDNCIGSERIKSENVIGKVENIYWRKECCLSKMFGAKRTESGYELNVHTKRYLHYVKFWNFTYPLRMILYRFRGIRLRRYKTERYFDAFWTLYSAGINPSSKIHDFPSLSPNEWMRVASTAKSSRLAGFVLDGVAKLPESLRPPKELMQSWIVAVLRENGKHIDNNRVIAEIFGKWMNAGLHPVLLKGQGCARMYPEPTHRIIGDIDIYISPPEWDKAMDIVKSLPPEYTHFPEKSKHVEFIWQGKTIEMHRRSAEMTHYRKKNAEYQEWSEAVLPNSTAGYHIGDQWIATPPAEFNAFYLFAHLWCHSINGRSKIRSISDWLMLLRRERGELDLEALKQRLIQFKLLEPWQAMGCFSVKYLGEKVQNIPFYDSSKMEFADKLYRYFNWEMSRLGNLNTSKNALWRKLCNLRHHLRHTFAKIGVFPASTVLTCLYNIFYSGIRSCLNLDFLKIQDGFSRYLRLV